MNWFSICIACHPVETSSRADPLVIVNEPLTQQELTEYDEMGFLVRRGLFSDQEIEAC